MTFLQTANESLELIIIREKGCFELLLTIIVDVILAEVHLLQIFVYTRIRQAISWWLP